MLAAVNSSAWLQESLHGCGSSSPPFIVHFFFKHMGGLGPISPLLSRAAAFNSLGAPALALMLVDSHFFSYCSHSLCRSFSQRKSRSPSLGYTLAFVTLLVTARRFVLHALRFTALLLDS